MDEFQIVRSLLLRVGRGLGPSSRLAQAIVEWAAPHVDWLFGAPQEAGTEIDFARLIAGVTDAPAADETRPLALVLASELADVLEFAPFDRALLGIMIACDRLPRAAGLARILGTRGCDLPALLGALAGASAPEAARTVRNSPVLRLGLVDFVTNRLGEVTVVVRWTLERLLDHAPAAGGDLIGLLVGKRREARLGLDDFGGVADLDFLVALLRGAAREHASGINILVHGPPGTGKTELALTLAASAGLPIHAVGEADAEGQEPNRWERVGALQIAQRLLGPRGHAVLLFDEMEDFIGDATPGPGDWFSDREGSKVFVNRMLETNPIPVIWTTNAIGNVDDAILRRMSYVLKVDLPSPVTAKRMLTRIAADESVSPGAALERLLDVPETATVLRTAARAARLAGEADGGARPAHSLVQALRGGPLALDFVEPLDLDLFESDRPIGPLVEGIVQGGALDVSLLLSGPPGTGKTALAHHLARALDRPLIVRRASDLLSKWVGETEAAIAGSFAEARNRGGVLLFDEADSLLFDRRTARASWEVSQVNELLTWLDRHPLPVIAATNHPDHLDPATLRRFVFKLHLLPLAGEKLDRAFEMHFGMAAPADLHDLRTLTPGDFAVVRRQLRFDPASGPGALVARLRAEADAKPEHGGRMGFG
ncbi:MAG: AAA family ATPase [Sphingobium sp.]|nr:AAA family ATPase [Sphingobium sp.]